MAVIKPASTSLRLELSLGQEGGKEITKSVAVSGVDINATPDALYNTANALAALLEHPMVNIKHTATGHITE